MKIENIRTAQCNLSIGAKKHTGGTASGPTFQRRREEREEEEARAEEEGCGGGERGGVVAPRAVWYVVWVR